MDAMDTISSTANKLLKEFSLDNRYEVISLTAYEGKINIQENINNFLDKEFIECKSCKSERVITASIKNHLLIELLSLPTDLEASISISNLSDIGAIQNNYAGEVHLYLDDIPKTIKINDIYFLRGAIGFCGQDRWGLRVTTGHYKAFAYRSNDQWEVYDDLRDGISLNTKKKENIEMLLYSK
ncbi:uncharacterized protein LOC132952903 [Metopolophium dirhodum]|uniref:uncharacterized protein LOC132936384 n=2 Tax=Metopolophium dirhodum TaxID=44670 RepID=UPI00298FB4B2|nr:uncharacterized protein LOC132936384 [Metopolophium dirhodum]XP_060859157.1 uncharacterized protein LOC132936442 [Metopolophium dirhodum]XP_060859850.1 uncharacterized protein LOC132937038 [Metopolophium dirhodum]XP_060868667.1 uncharacterized protein LOC132943661 [Metopolophium dirhodum]XP_060873559.1 uncharacterized protein LOC132947316 [Metopolophium dirhodum]XP_060873582.1 uncharacterized protein LOC132947335 [Metopolophium dirhodum]XP_060874027.1 uncharacterized protein LOC132947815 [